MRRRGLRGVGFSLRVFVLNKAQNAQAEAYAPSAFRNSQVNLNTQTG